MADRTPTVDLRARGIATGNVKRRLRRNDEYSKEVLSKLIRGTSDPATQSTQRTGKTGIKPDSTYVQDIAGDTATSITNSENAMQMLSDLELNEQVLVATIIAPTDMTTSELTYYCTDPRFKDIQAELIEGPQDYFDNVYKIKQRFPKWLKDILFRKGSSCIAVLPESSIDQVINSDTRLSVESMRSEFGIDGAPTHYGILGNPKRKYKLEIPEPKGKTKGRTRGEVVALEGYVEAATFDAVVGPDYYHVTVSDNPNLLKYPDVHRKQVADSINARYATRRFGVSVEAVTPGVAKDPSSLFRDPRYVQTPVERILPLSALSRPTVGHPLLMTLPPESVIPVYVPGDPSQHVAYFVAVDSQGNPIKSNMTANYYSDIRKQSQSFSDQSSQLMSQARLLQDGSAPLRDGRINEAVRLFQDSIIRELIERLQNGDHGSRADLEIAKPQDVFRLMLSRALQEKQTQLLYIPVSLMSYMAFDYNADGVGKSLLEASNILTSMRSMLMVSNMLAALKNTINHKVVGVKFDPDDPAPDQTLEGILDRLVSMSNPAFPFGASNPVDMVDYIARAGYQIKTSGNDAYPETEVTVDFAASSNVQVNTELEESLRKQQSRSIGVPPEIVDMSNNVDFATSVISSNLLFSKRASAYQDEFVRFVSELMQKFLLNDQPLTDKIRRIIRSNWSKLSYNEPETDEGVARATVDFIYSLNVRLPKADLAKLEVQAKDFEVYTDFLDKVLPSFIAAEFFDAAVDGDSTEAVQTLVAGTRAILVRRWLQDNGVFPQLFELVSKEIDGERTLSLLEQEESYKEGLSANMMGYLERSLKRAAKNNAKLKPLKEKAAENSSGGGGGFGGGGGDAFGGGGGDMGGGFGGGDAGGGDDFGMGGDTGEGATGGADLDTGLPALDTEQPATDEAEQPPADAEDGAVDEAAARRDEAAQRRKEKEEEEEAERLRKAEADKSK